MEELKVAVRIPYPMEDVWRFIAEHRHYKSWSGHEEMELVQEGDPPPNGVGAVRKLRLAGFWLTERITSFDPPRGLAHQIVEGLPLVDDYRGHVTLKRGDEQTIVTYVLSFEPRFPLTGGFIRRSLQRSLDRMLDGLSHAVRRGV